MIWDDMGLWGRGCWWIDGCSMQHGAWKSDGKCTWLWGFPTACLVGICGYWNGRMFLVPKLLEGKIGRSQRSLCPQVNINAIDPCTTSVEPFHVRRTLGKLLPSVVGNIGKMPYINDFRLLIGLGTCKTGQPDMSDMLAHCAATTITYTDLWWALMDYHTWTSIYDWSIHIICIIYPFPFCDAILSPFKPCMSHAWAMSPPHPALRNQGVLQMSGEVNLGEDDVESTTLVDTLGTKLTPHGTVFLDARDSFVVAFFGVGKILGRSWESEGFPFFSSVFEFLKETKNREFWIVWTCLNNSLDVIGLVWTTCSTPKSYVFPTTWGIFFGLVSMFWR